jgi:predicted P-loop ATPase
VRSTVSWAVPELRLSFGAPLTESDLRGLESRWISAPLATAAGIRRVSSDEGREMFARKRDDMAGLIIPYTWPGESGVREYRLRRDHPELEMDPETKAFREVNKYIGPPGRSNLIYVPPTIGPTDLQNVALPVVLTEGEFKTLALDRAATSDTERRRFLPLGLSGVWNWRGTIGKTSGPDGLRRDVKGVVPDFDRIAWKKRRVFVAFDADIVRKPKVKAARAELMRELRRREGHVGVIEWPETQGKGIDDFLASQGLDAFLALMASAPLQEGGWRSRLIVNREGAPKGLLANACTVLRYAPEWDGVLAYNEFALAVTVLHDTPWSVRVPHVWTDHDDQLTTEWLQHQGIHVSLEVAGQAVQTVAHEHRFHPVRDYLNGLEWDGKNRVESWLSKYLGVEDTAYSRAVGQRWMISAAARIFEPGAKADCCLILEGDQGSGKSSALRILAAPWFTDEIAELGSKDAALQCQGAWIIELAELDSMSRADVGRIKAFMSRSVDRFRPPYGKRLIDSPRQCVFAGSVNHKDYLRDETGARRFWPIECHSIDLASLRRDRDQLWAEAVALYGEGQPWWLESSVLVETAAIEQDRRLEGDPWLGLLADWLESRTDASVEEALQFCLEKPKAQWTQADKARIGRCFKTLKWERYKAGPRTEREWRYRRVSQ